jgi:hypothetical protein
MDDFDKHLTTIKTTWPLQQELCCGLERWLTEGRQRRYARPAKEEYKAARRQQARIGWECAMKGMLGCEWACHQEHAKDGVTRGHTGSMVGDTWCSQVSDWLVKETGNYWRKRNDERQAASTPNEPGKSRALAEAEAGVASLYGRVLEVAEQDRELFSVPLERRLEMPLATMQEWLKSSREIVNVMARRQRERLEGGQPDIREAMIPISTEEAERLCLRQEAKKARQQEATAAKAAEKVQEMERLAQEQEEEQERRSATAAEKGKKRAEAEKPSLLTTLMEAARRMAKNKRAERARKQSDSKEKSTLAAKEKATKKRSRNEMKERNACKQMQHWMDKVGPGRKPRFRDGTAGSTQEQQAEHGQSHKRAATDNTMLYHSPESD